MTSSSPEQKLDVRPVRSGDRDAWLRLWDGYLEFYQHQLEPAVTEETFARLVERRERMWGLVAETAGSLAGIVNVVDHASTWAPDGYVYLEDLYVDTRCRGQGVATALIKAVITEAGGRKVYWQTRQDNPARRLYDRLATFDGYVVYEHPVD